MLLQTGDSEFVLGDEFVPVLEGIDLHVGKTVIREFEQLNFSGRLVQSNLVKKLFEGFAGGLLVLDPLVFDGPVGFLKFGDSFSSAIEFFFESGFFEVGEFELGVELLNSFLIVSDDFEMLPDGILGNNKIFFFVVELIESFFVLLFGVGELIFEFSNKILVFIDKFVFLVDSFLELMKFFIELLGLRL